MYFIFQSSFLYLSISHKRIITIRVVLSSAAICGEVMGAAKKKHKNKYIGNIGLAVRFFT